MDLSTARQTITTHLERMRSAFTQPVFDEWAIIAPNAKHRGVLAYGGPRIEAFTAQFQKDIAPLRNVAAGRTLAPGDFDFVVEAPGTQHDALIKTGAGSYLILNNTARTMADIRVSPHWVKAQKIFVELSDKFRADPLEAPSA